MDSQATSRGRQGGTGGIWIERPRGLSMRRARSRSRIPSQSNPELHILDSSPGRGFLPLLHGTWEAQSQQPMSVECKSSFLNMTLSLTYRYADDEWKRSKASDEAKDDEFCNMNATSQEGSRYSNDYESLHVGVSRLAQKGRLILCSIPQRWPSFVPICQPQGDSKVHQRTPLQSRGRSWSQSSLHPGL